MKKFFTVLLTIAVLTVTCITPFAASAATSGDFEYTVVSGYARIDSYTGSAVNVVIPETLGGYAVKVIAHSAFKDNTVIETVVFPNSLTEIATTAFMSCTNLKTVTFPANLSIIGDAAFDFCSSLATVTFTGSLQSLGNVAFGYCSSLAYINLPQGLTQIKSMTFTTCTNLAYVKIPHSVTSILSSAFDSVNTNLLTIVGCAGSTAETFAANNGFVFATTPCLVHTFSQGACTCCARLLGDVNRDGVLNNDDATALSLYLNGSATIDLSVADVNQDGSINATDVVTILLYLAGQYQWPN